jgi:O-antigen ligase
MRAATGGTLTPARETGRDNRLGVPLILLLVYLVMEYARPANPLKIPLLISVALFVRWLVEPNKRRSPQLVCFFLFLGVIAMMGPFAVNSFSIFTGFQTMAVQLLCICVPLMQFVSSMRKLRIFLSGWIVVFAYVALYGLTHAGRGPGGHIGDENDLALALNMVIPFTFAFVWSARRALARAASAITFVLMVVTVCVTFSRGGFLGLAAVLLYCFFIMMRRKALSVVFVGLAVLALFAAPDTYWQRLRTIVTEAEGTEHGTGELRRQYWALARQMFYANPVLGVGLYNFTWNVDRYQSAEDQERIGRSYAGQAVHSVYFMLLAELGSCGGVLFVLLIWYTLRDTERVLRVARWRDVPTGLHDRPADPRLREDLKEASLHAHAIRAALIGYLVSGTFLSVLTYPHFWLLVALTVSLHESTRRRLGLPSGAKL